VASAWAGHAGRSCHILAVLVVLALAACAPRTGWERTDRRSCAPAGPPRLCLLAAPDAQLVATAGGATLVPGECAVASRARGGRLRVRVHDGRRGASSIRRVGVRRGQTTWISALGGQIRVVERLGCGPD
jgi:hypothetical protein